MKRLVTILLCAFVAGGTAIGADPELGAVAGSWSNVSGGDPAYYELNVLVGNEMQVRWGRPLITDKSGLGFEGIGGLPATVPVSTAFKVGTLRHFNNEVGTDTAADSVDLTITLDFSSPVATVAGTYTLTVDETDNVGDPPESPISDDFIDIADSPSPQIIDLGGTLYEFELVGFGPTAGEVTDQFRSPEGGTNSTFLWAKLTLVPPEPSEPKVDIKPTSCPNPLNVKSNGVLPVAILGSAEYDVTQVDTTTILLEGVAPLRWSLEDVAGPVGPDAEECECTTAGPDGYLDLTLKFKKQDVVAAIGSVDDGLVLPLFLTWDLLDGTPQQGSDCVWIRKKGK